MAIIPQISMFSWENEIENLGDNERLKFVLENMPDEDLVVKLEEERGRGRDDYPVRAMWNMFIAMIVFGHCSMASLLREMRRNVQLRWMCGFQNGQVPSESAASRFMSKLIYNQIEVFNIFIALADSLYDILPDFGETLAIDSKWISSLANKISGRNSPDGRSETDAEWGKKVYSGINAEGKEWTKEMKCFGFKIHLIVDAKYELPVAFVIAGANSSDIVWGKKLLEKLATDRPHVIERCRYLTADKGYDDTEFIQWLQDAKQNIKPVIDKRTMWKVETEKEVPKCPQRYYNEHGEVFCYSLEKGERHSMVAIGYDRDRDAQRFRCPALHYGITCSEQGICELAKTIRILLSTDPRIFTQVGRTQYQWKRIYAARTAVERVNSRLDLSFGFETRRVRGKPKMKLFASLAFAVMNALAVGSIKAGKLDRMRSLVKAA
jgi:transposase